MLAERIRAVIDSHGFQIDDDQVLKVTCSLGFACFPFMPGNPQKFSWENVVHIADAGLYAAKRSGRNAWVGLSATAKLTEPDGLLQRLRDNSAQCIASGELEVESSLEDPNQLVWE